ncbi:ATP-binding protein [Salmonella enterica]|nr:ATP-binding protein [Salmonella enterica]HAU6739645.1 ATP-binding protein [Salmonella enterica subsp. enterica serovar Fresno]EHM2311833.1 ATP-binding protein [Salmonella enterica]EHM2390065.1 ATP-binding protein [Salmonella enterica]EHM2420744.1 ATP-binding protein [Salmonella enterica]
MKSISLPPYAPTLIESTRAIGYTLEAAIADIIDNSISAQASYTDIFFFPIGNSYIAIMDDGCGMAADEIDNAMRYGSQNPNEKRTENDLGRFGLGLKTASLSQCRTLTVVSKQRDCIEARRWDIDHVIKIQDWSLLVLESEEIDQIPHIDNLKKIKSGTLVVWQNLDRLKTGEIDLEQSMGKKMDEMRKHLSLVFHRYINGESGIRRLNIRMNNTSVEPVDPFLSHRNTQIMSDESIYIKNSKIIVRPYILPHISDLSKEEIGSLGGKEGLRKRQGFYIYRNKRLLIWGTWFRMMRQGELSKLARIQIDIPNELDSLWTLDIKKSTAIPPEIVRNNLKSIVESLADKSKNTWVFRGKRETQDSVIHIWQRFKGKNGGCYYNINREHPLVEAFSDTTQNIRNMVESLLKSIEFGIPLNQLYLDLTSEKMIENDTSINKHEAERIFHELLGENSISKDKIDLLNTLEITEPFMDYPDLIEHYRRKIIHDNN